MSLKLPSMGIQNTHRLITDVFGGYDHHLKIADGSWYEQTNISTEHYPLFSPRKPRGVVRQLTAPGGLIEKDALCYVDNRTLFVNDHPTAINDLAAGEKQLVSMGAYVCIWPDKVYYNTEDPTDYGSMEADWQYTGDVTYTPCRIDGTVYESVYVGEEEPETSVELWISTAGGSRVAMQYSASYEGWVELATVYTRLDFTTQGQIPRVLAAYDGVEISGSSYDDVNGDKLLQAVGGEEASENDWIVVVGLLGERIVKSGESIRIRRTVPDMDFVCEAQNRLWGCFYGNDGTQNLNEIYCCALGDFKNWRQYQGLSTDSWTASVGSDGPWTGAVNYLGKPVFFKENRIHEVFIYSAGAHELREIVCRGVQKGSHKSLRVVNETLYYKSRSDVCAWQDGFPVTVSEALGQEKYYAAVAGAFGQRYYLSMRDGAGQWHLFVYDLKTGLWCREDDLHALEFAAVDDELFAVDAETGELLALNGTLGTPEEAVTWAAETGIQAYEYPDHKYISRYNIRLQMAENAEATVYLQYDSDGTWHESGHVEKKGIGTVTLPIRPRRCDHLRFRIAGEGDVKILSIARILEMGSDV